MVDGSLLRQRLAAIISDLELAGDLSAEETAGLLSGARALALAVSSKVAFGVSLFRFLQSSDVMISHHYEAELLDGAP